MVKIKIKRPVSHSIIFPERTMRKVGRGGRKKGFLGIQGPRPLIAVRHKGCWRGLVKATNRLWKRVGSLARGVAAKDVARSTQVSQKGSTVGCGKTARASFSSVLTLHAFTLERIYRGVRYLSVQHVPHTRPASCHTAERVTTARKKPANKVAAFRTCNLPHLSPCPRASVPLLPHLPPGWLG